MLDRFLKIIHTALGIGLLLIVVRIIVVLRAL